MQRLRIQAVMESYVSFLEGLVAVFQKRHARRKQRKLEQSIKKKNRFFLFDWFLDFIWAVFFVLLVNQYFIQAYQIPSGSMEKTLLIGDFLFVNKLVFGPEILPGWGDLPSFWKPEEGEIVIFENPELNSRGVFQDLIQRLIYMASFSLIDLDRDPQSGDSVARFLVKRALFKGPLYLRFIDGKIFVQPWALAADQGFSEDFYQQSLGLSYELFHLIDEKDYAYYSQLAQREAYREKGLTLDKFDIPSLRSERLDAWTFRWLLSQKQLVLDPLGASVELSEALRYEIGIYVPHDFFMALGDSRDNSYDSRGFGPLSSQRILGRSSLRYFPLPRFGWTQ